MHAALILQNFMYAATRFGEVKEVLLATFDGRSLLRCQSMGFVCFDGTTLPLHNATSTMRDTALYARYRNATVFTNYVQVRRQHCSCSILFSLTVCRSRPTNLSACCLYSCQNR